MQTLRLDFIMTELERLSQKIKDSLTSRIEEVIEAESKTLRLDVVLGQIREVIASKLKI